MNTFSHVPPGFRFHPTDEELVDYYLRKKVASRRIDLDVIKDVDLYKIEPWDLQEICRIGTEEQNEWYFFSHKDKKYPTGTRTNRATTAGFWKATGRDKAIYAKQELVGMRKTLVFYKGRAPNGQKSDWIMHEYRLETDENGTPQEEGWVVCRVFKKRVTTTTMRKVVMSEHDSPTCSWYDHDQAAAAVSLIHDHFDHHSPNNQTSDSNNNLSYPQHPPYPNCKKELLDHFNLPPLFQQFVPNHQFLESPKLLLQSNIMPPPYHVNHNANNSLLPSSLIHQQEEQQNFHAIYGNNIIEQAAGVDDQVTDWRVLDKFVASQLSQDDINNNNNNALSKDTADNNMFQGTTDIDSNNSVQLITSHDQETIMDASTSTSSTCPIDLWK